jgi:hypothetical protein
MVGADDNTDGLADGMSVGAVDVGFLEDAFVGLKVDGVSVGV